MYLELEKFKEKLIKQQGCSAMTIACLPEYLEDAEALMDEYLGKNFGVQEYTERRDTNYQGSIVLWRSPVIEVTEIKIVETTYYCGEEINQYRYLDPVTTWDGLNVIRTGACDCDRRVYDITYKAGLDPLPASFGLVTKAIVNQLIASQGDIGVLMESPREIEEAQNPSIGGTFKQRFTRAGAVAGTTKLDQLMKPLSKYATKIKLG